MRTSGSASRARSAAARLCARYWQPLYGFARRRGRGSEDAQDSVQSFLAHLIATDRQVPQTRERRRGEPGDAIAAYAAVDAGTPARAGATLSRTT